MTTLVDVLHHALEPGQERHDRQRRMYSTKIPIGRRPMASPSPVHADDHQDDLDQAARTEIAIGTTWYRAPVLEENIFDRVLDALRDGATPPALVETQSTPGASVR